MQYIKRFMEDVVFDPDFGRQMRFITGPRQCGKTTLAAEKLRAEGTGELYFNWDSREVKQKYREQGEMILEGGGKKKKWVCFDEIHKMAKWKNILKGIFDARENNYFFIVTGSARLDLFRRSGDSLAGRYFTFRMNPFIMAEMTGRREGFTLPGNNPLDHVTGNIEGKRGAQGVMEDMLKHGCFPEPLLTGKESFSRAWNEQYFDRVIKEDMRDLSALHYLDKVAELALILPGKIGAPLSIESLAGDLELNFRTVKNYLRHMGINYLIFELAPYTGGIRGLNKKMKKVYFYDYALVKDEAARFENFAALELKARVDLWNSASADKYELCFVRNRAKKECDFLVLKNGKPYFMCEAKLSSDEIDVHNRHFSDALGKIPFVQVVKKENVAKADSKRFFVVSASRFFA